VKETRQLRAHERALLCQKHNLTTAPRTYHGGRCGCLLGVLVVQRLGRVRAEEELEKARFQFRHDGKPVAQQLDAASGIEPSYAQGLNDGFTVGHELKRRTRSGALLPWSARGKTCTSWSFPRNSEHHRNCVCWFGKPRRVGLKPPSFLTRRRSVSEAELVRKGYVVTHLTGEIEFLD
jgi:hypothetical protein